MVKFCLTILSGTRTAQMQVVFRFGEIKWMRLGWPSRLSGWPFHFNENIGENSPIIQTAQADS